MLMTISEYLSKKPKPFLTVLGVLLVLFIGYIDYFTGYEISFSIFYVFPIVLIAWFAGRLYAVFISILSAAIWLSADLLSGHSYSHYTIPLWNSIMRLGFFLTFTYLLTTIKRLLEHKTDLSQKDSLTGVANGRYFTELANIEINRPVRFNHPLTIAYIDIDNFKQVNDVSGHSTGDRLLNSVAETIKKNIRSIDIVARLGGDEFSILMPEAGAGTGKDSHR
jgi:predicted signal transduction protein with EAL and GGDEF domain